MAIYFKDDYMCVYPTLLLLDLIQRTKKGFVISRRSISETRDMWNCPLTVFDGPCLMEGDLARELSSLGSLPEPEDFCRGRQGGEYTVNNGGIQ